MARRLDDDDEMPAKSAAQEIADYEREVNEGLKRFHTRTHWEATEEKTPLSVLLGREPDSLSKLTREQLLERMAGYGVELSVDLSVDDCLSILRGFREIEQNMRKETTRGLFDYFAQNGIDPRSVMQAVYAVGAHMGISPFCELNLRERGLMLGDSHGAEHFRTEKMCVDPLKRIGARSYKAPGQKSNAARAEASRVQQGNTNRKRKVRRRRRLRNNNHA